MFKERFFSLLEVNGKYGTAKIFTDSVEDQAYNQVKAMMDHEVVEGTSVRLMPDIHYGKGATVGTSIVLPEDRSEWRVSPNVVGVDIGCGMLSYKLAYSGEFNEYRFNELDDTIKKHVPSGFHVHKKLPREDRDPVKDLIDGLTVELTGKQHERITHSIGTLGGGNHFIELAVDENGDYWLTVHSGSRNLGVQVENHHQDIANSQTDEETVKLGLGYLTGELLEDYLNDMRIAQRFAAMNRKAMLDNIVENLPFHVEVVDSFDSVHNFIDMAHGIIRKGSTSAQDGERLLVPLNMKDGSLICKGLGNKDWNYSAPHGAGRKMSRTSAKKNIPMRKFKRDMEDVYTTSVKKSTLDEAPDAYKSHNEIIKNSQDTMEVIHHLKPVYNFKA